MFYCLSTLNTFMLIAKKIHKCIIFGEVNIMRVLKLELCGIKSIDKPISIDFCNKIIDYNIEKKSFIKGIYGPNGAGKTGIITAITLYKILVIYKSAIDHPLIRNSLINLINKKTKCLDISISYAYGDVENKTIDRYKHSLSISLINKEPFIVAEKYYKLNSKLEKTLLFETKKGEVVFNSYKEDNSILEKRCINLADKTTVSSIYASSVIKDDSFKKEAKHFICIDQLLRLVFNISLSFGSKDDALNNFNPKGDKLELLDYSQKFVAYLCEGRKFYLKNYEFLVDKKEIDSFENYINKMSLFIKVIQTNLLKIDPRKQSQDKDFIHYKLNFVYKDYSSDLQYESTGVKKLVDIYETLSHTANGGIGVVDEIDAGIHDIVINKIIEYFVKETNSQLLFTTHNVSLMEYLNEEDHSIDFLSTDSVLTKWIKNGNSSPVSAYLKGFIPHIPFNIESLDFSGKF